MAPANVLIGGSGEKPIALNAAMGNRRGIISGTTDSGKTVSLQVLAEGCSRIGVPVFLADVKGDLPGLAPAGTSKPAIAEPGIGEARVSVLDERGAPTPVERVFVGQTSLGD